MEITNLNLDSNSKDLHLQESSVCNENYTSKTNTPKNMSNIVSYSPLSNLEKINLKNAEERRKTLIFAATATDIPKYKWKDDNKHGVEYVEDVEPIEVAREVETEVEVGLLDCYRFSPLPNPNLETYCLQINDQNNDIKGNANQFPELLSEKGTQIEVGLLDLYSLSPRSIHEHENDFQSKKEEKQSNDDIQGLTGLALLVGSANVSSKNSPKNSTRNSPRNSSKSNRPRLNVENYLINQTELVVPTSQLRLNLKESSIYQSELVVPTSRQKSNIKNSLINAVPILKPRDIDEFNSISKTNRNDLQIRIEPESESSTISFVNMQCNSKFNSKVPTYNDLVNSSYKNYYVSEPLDATTVEAIVNTTTSLVSSKPESKKELKLKHKAIENLSCKNENNFSMPVSPKTPRKSSIPNFDNKRHCQLKDSEEMQEKANDRARKNESDELAVDSDQSE